METVSYVTRTKSIPFKKIFQFEVLQTLLMECTQLLSAPSAIISASQFSKRYSYFLLAPSIKQLLTSGRFATIHENQDSVEFNYDTGEFQLVIHENSKEYDPSFCSKQQMDQYIKHYFASHLVSLWTSISNLTGIKMDLLWENTYIYISWICLQQVEAPRAKENFIYLTQEADGSLFGLKENPFRTFSTKSLIRQKCCMYFMLPSAANQKCRNCPLICKDS